MVDETKIQAMLDKHDIAETVILSFHCRDRGEWDALKGCFHPNATVSVSWFSGPVREFIESSMEMVSSRAPGEHSKHMMANPLVRLRGDRALSEYDVILHQRRILDGIEMDFQTWSRYLDLLERREGVWRIFQRTAIYEKDRLDPYDPGKVPESFYASLNLEGYPPNIRYHCYRNARSGRGPSSEIVLANSEEERVVRESGEGWLLGNGI